MSWWREAELARCAQSEGLARARQVIVARCASRSASTRPGPVPVRLAVVGSDSLTACRRPSHRSTPVRRVKQHCRGGARARRRSQRQPPRFENAKCEPVAVAEESLRRSRGRGTQLRSRCPRDATGMLGRLIDGQLGAMHETRRPPKRVRGAMPPAPAQWSPPSVCALTHQCAQATCSSTCTSYRRPPSSSPITVRVRGVIERA